MDDDLSPFAQNRNAAYLRLKSDPELITKLKAFGASDSKIETLFEACSTICSSWHEVRVVQEGKVSIALRERFANLADEMAELMLTDGFLRSILVGDEEIIERAWSLEENNRSCEYRIRPSDYNIHPPYHDEHAYHPLLELLPLRAYLRGLADILRTDFVNPDLRTACDVYDDWFPRKPNVKRIIVELVFLKLSDLFPKRTRGRNVIIAKIVSNLLKTEITPNDVTQYLKGSRKPYSK